MGSKAEGHSDTSIEHSDKHANRGKTLFARCAIELWLAEDRRKYFRLRISLNEVGSGGIWRLSGRSTIFCFTRSSSRCSLPATRQRIHVVSLFSNQRTLRWRHEWGTNYM